MPDRDNLGCRTSLAGRDRGNLLRFLDGAGIEPTEPERALRELIARKVAHCTQE